MKRVNHDYEAWSRPKFARFERSRKCLRWEGIFLSYVACFVAAQHELNPLPPRTPPSKSMGFFYFLFHLPG